MNIFIKMLKMGAILSLFFFFILSAIAIPSLMREPQILRVHNKNISGESRSIEGILENGGKIKAKYSKSFFDKAQPGDTIRFKVPYRLLIKEGQIASIDFREGIWLWPVMIISSLFPVLIFFPNYRISKLRFSYWLIGAAELLNIFALSTFILPL